MRVITLIIVLGVFAFFPLFSFGQNAPVVFVDDAYMAQRMTKHTACKGVSISIDDRFPAEYRVKVKRGPLDDFYVSYHGQMIGDGRTYFYGSTARDACSIIMRHFRNK